MCCTIHAQKEQQVTHEIHTQEGLQCRSFGKSGCGSSLECRLNSEGGHMANLMIKKPERLHALPHIDDHRGHR